jgi:hypothetical protein
MEALKGARIISSASIQPCLSKTPVVLARCHSAAASVFVRSVAKTLIAEPSFEII